MKLQFTIDPAKPKQGDMENIKFNEILLKLKREKKEVEALALVKAFAVQQDLVGKRRLLSEYDKLT